MDGGRSSEFQALYGHFPPSRHAAPVGPVCTSISPWSCGLAAEISLMAKLDESGRSSVVGAIGNHGETDETDRSGPGDVVDDRL
jgi:hypothetical protein